MTPVPPARIVSLLPAATDILLSLGLGERLVARSHECDGEGVDALPFVTRSKLPPGEADSAAIDDSVRALLSQALSIYEVDAEALRALRPDLIVTQAQCEVCAVSVEQVQSIVSQWTDHEVKLVSLAAEDLAGIWRDLRAVAVACGVAQRGEDVVAACESEMNKISAATRDLPKPSVATVEWLDPLMTAGNWIPELIDLAGGRNLFGEAGKHSPWMDWDAFRAADPDVIVILPCGFDVARTRREMPALTSRPGWGGLRAVRDKRVYLADGNAYFNRPGPRIVESLHILAQLLHPETFPRAFPGTSWSQM